MLTKEIRLNRAIRAQFQSLFLKNQRKVVPLEFKDLNNTRKAKFLDEILDEVEEVKKKIERGEKINLGQLSALSKQIEIEEKYLIDEYLKIKSFCFISQAALISTQTPSPLANKPAETLISVILTLIALSIILIISLLYLSFTLLSNSITLSPFSSFLCSTLESIAKAISQQLASGANANTKQVSLASTRLNSSPALTVHP